jgi:hypothetical protein
MKNLLTIVIFSFLLSVFGSTINAQVAINKDGSLPDTNSIFHIKGDIIQKNIIIEPGQDGKVGLGTTSPKATLDIYSTTSKGLKIQLNNSSTSLDSVVGISTNIYTSSALSPIYGIINNLSGQAVSKYGVVNILDNSSYFGYQFANFNKLSGDKAGNQYGNYTEIDHSGNGEHYGTYKDVSGSGSGPHFANYNLLSGNGTGEQYGNYTDICNSGDAVHYGMYNKIHGNGNGTHYANINILSGEGTGWQFGNAIEVVNSGDGTHIGTFRVLMGDGNGTHYANYDLLAGNGTGSQYGDYTDIRNSGDAMHYGAYRILAGSGNGEKYGSYNIIDTNAGGKHYAIYANATKNAPDVYAGYFVGDVNVKTGNLNVEDKLTAPASGDTDMKAYVYGFVSSWGDISIDRSSSGFTVSKTSTGVYKITVNGVSDDDYIVSATTEYDGTPILTNVDYLSNAGNEFNVLTFNLSGNPVNRSFHFVVYRK